MSTQTQILQNIPIDPLTGALAVPIYQTSSFEQQAPGVNKGFDYSRSNNPTREVLENLIASLENGQQGFALSSGVAAIDTVLKTLSANDHIVAVEDIYGGAYRLFEQVYKKFGVDVTYVDTTDIDQVKRAITDKTKLIWLETPSNPTLKVTDIQSIAKIAKHKNILLCVDNTFATPVSQKPLDLGADIVVHSASKYIAGHCDVIAGLVVTKTKTLGEIIKFHQNASGAILGPTDSFLTIRGIETLNFRYKVHCQNAQIIAEFLQNNPKIKNIYYPGLPDSPSHSIASKQQKYFGAVVSFDLHQDTSEEALKFVKSLKLFHLAESLGGIKSMSCLPDQMSHKTVAKAAKLKSGITPSLIRLSIGLEEPEDLIKDLQQAFEKL
ncbi:trans-sulfuration enzyme family protein [Myroides sp. LJL116]